MKLKFLLVQIIISTLLLSSCSKKISISENEPNIILPEKINKNAASKVENSLKYIVYSSFGGLGMGGSSTLYIFDDDTFFSYSPSVQIITISVDGENNTSEFRSSALMGFIKDKGFNSQILNLNEFMENDYVENYINKKTEIICIDASVRNIDFSFENNLVNLSSNNDCTTRNNAFERLFELGVGKSKTGDGKDVLVFEKLGFFTLYIFDDDTYIKHYKSKSSKPNELVRTKLESKTYLELLKKLNSNSFESNLSLKDCKERDFYRINFDRNKSVSALEGCGKNTNPEVISSFSLIDSIN